VTVQAFCGASASRLDFKPATGTPTVGVDVIVRDPTVSSDYSEWKMYVGGTSECIATGMVTPSTD
jgi:hypothetical protein